jgi:hypothetical protein
MKKERKIKRLSTPHHQMGEQRKIREEKTLSSVFMCLIFPERCIMCYSVYLYCQNAYNYDLWGRERKRYPQDHQFLGRLGILLASSIKLRIVLHIKQSKLPCSHFNFIANFLQERSKSKLHSPESPLTILFKIYLSPSLVPSYDQEMPDSWKNIKHGRNQGLPEMPHFNMEGIKLPRMRVAEQSENNCKCHLEY